MKRCVPYGNMLLQKHVLLLYVTNKPGVMSQVSGLFTRRGYNIDSVAVGITDDPKKSVITIVLKGTDEDLSQFKGQLLKLADVITVRELNYHDSISRELLLIRIHAIAKDREELTTIVEVFGGKIAEITEETMLIEASGNARCINGMITMLKRFGIVDMSRTGQVALDFSITDLQ